MWGGTTFSFVCRYFSPKVVISLLDGIWGQRNGFRDLWQPQSNIWGSQDQCFQVFVEVCPRHCHCEEEFYLENQAKNFFSPKIISNDQICIPIVFLRCLELPCKLWKQNIYVKSSIFLKIRLFHQNLMKKSQFLAWPRLFKLRNALGSLQILG